MEHTQRSKPDSVPKTYYQKSRSIDYTQMWPIALAPSIPLVGIALKNHPKARNITIGTIAVGVLLYAHGAAVGGSKDVSK